MCDWCFRAECVDEKQCKGRPGNSPLLTSRTFQEVYRRVVGVIGPWPLAPKLFWDGSQPYFFGAIRAHVMGPRPHVTAAGAVNQITCGICGQAVDGRGHVDHITPWKRYMAEKLEAAAAERGAAWQGGHVPKDLVQVMYNDPVNLQPAHASCNESKSDFVPGLGAAVRKMNKEQELAEARAYLEREKEKAAHEAKAWSACRDEIFGKKKDDHRDPPPDPGAGGIPA